MRDTAVISLLAAAALAGEVPPARLDPAAPPAAFEIDAAERYRTSTCGRVWGVLVPGAGRFCLHRPVEGAVLLGLAAGEGAAAAALWPRRSGDTFSDGGALVPLLGLQNLYVISMGLDALDLHRARHHPYTPPEDLGDMVAAPFRGEVMARPGVWGGLAVLTGGAVALTVATSSFDPQPRPNVFGAELPPAVGYPLLGAVDAATFLHVAIGEEIAFRGIVQSGLTRALDPTAGWLLGSLIFGAFHVPNVFALPAEQRVPYLAISIPYITATGAWLGLIYRWYGYRLGPPVAVHFWYDAVLGGLAFAMDPDDHPFSLRVRLQF